MKILTALMAAGVCLAQVEHQQHHPPQDAAEYAKILEDPSRDEWQKPHEVVMGLEIKPTDVVADIGSGSGYFSRRFARHAAKVYAVDIDPRLLKMAEGPKNLTTVLAAPDDPKLPAGSMDIIFLCDVLHHIENRPAYFEKLKAALKPGGRVVNIDFFKKELKVGPPVSMKLSEEEVRADFVKSGFHLSKTVKVLPLQYWLEFQP